MIPTDAQLLGLLNRYFSKGNGYYAADAIRDLRALFAQPEPKDAPRMSARLAIAMRMMPGALAVCEDLNACCARALQIADALIAADKETSK